MQMREETQGINWVRPHQQEAQDTEGPVGCYWIHGGDYFLLTTAFLLLCFSHSFCLSLLFPYTNNFSK